MDEASAPQGHLPLPAQPVLKGQGLGRLKSEPGSGKQDRGKTCFRRLRALGWFKRETNRTSTDFGECTYMC